MDAAQEAHYTTTTWRVTAHTQSSFPAVWEGYKAALVASNIAIFNVVVVGGILLTPHLFPGNDAFIPSLFGNL